MSIESATLIANAIDGVAAAIETCGSVYLIVKLFQWLFGRRN